jgi:hypothetical protein
MQAVLFKNSGRCTGAKLCISAVVITQIILYCTFGLLFDLMRLLYSCAITTAHFPVVGFRLF